MIVKKNNTKHEKNKKDGLESLTKDKSTNSFPLKPSLKLII